MTRHPCPCCRNLTFGHPANGSYDICPVCFWEDDPVQLADPDYEGGANVPSLNQARENFARFGAMEERFRDAVRPPRRDEVPERGGHE